jgi:hypothetical protein
MDLLLLHPFEDLVPLVEDLGIPAAPLRPSFEASL